MNQHIKIFGSDVDISESAILESNYLQDIKEDINELFESLKDQDESISDTISDVSDITFASSPDFSDVHEWKKKSVEKLQEVDEDLDEFTGKNNEVDVEAVMHHIEAEMSKAITSKGKARFADFKGASDSSDLAKLMEYNEEKGKEKDKEIEKAEDVRENALQDQNKHSSRDVINKVFDDYKNGEINYEQYVAIVRQVEKTSSNMNEEELEDKATTNFLDYLDDNDMLDDYLADHQPFVDYIVDKKFSMLWDYSEGYIPIFYKNTGEKTIERMEELWYKEIKKSNQTKVADLDTFREIKREKIKGQEKVKLSKYLKRAGRVFGWAGVGYGFYDDLANNGKTVGEATAHSGALLAIGGVVAVTMAPGALAVGVGVAGAMVFEFAYSHNFLGLQDGVDKVGEKLSEWGSAIGDFFKSPGEATTAG